MPQSKVQMDPVFEKRLRDAQAHAAAEAAARARGEQVRWFRPAGWAGDPFDLAGFRPPFSRAAANAGYLAAVKDAADPGTSGDIVAAATMADYLATMERAFVARHTLRRGRATAHMLGRKAGHGHDGGPLVQCGLEYLRGVLAQSRAEGGA